MDQRGEMQAQLGLAGNRLCHGGRSWLPKWASKVANNQKMGTNGEMHYCANAAMHKYTNEEIGN